MTLHHLFHYLYHYHVQTTQNVQAAINNVSNIQLQTRQQQDSQNDQQNVKNQEQKQNWQKVRYKKKIKSSFGNIDFRKHQTSISDYWLNKPIETSNTYEKLNIEETLDIRKKLDTNLNIIETKASPLFVKGVEHTIPLKQLLEEISKNQYMLKILRNNQIKTQLLSTEKYLAIMDALKKKRYSGFYILKQKR